MHKILLVAVVISCVCISVASSSDLDWNLIQSNDTLDLYLQERFAGTFFHSVEVPGNGKTIELTSHLSVSVGGEGDMKLRERRMYDRTGKLIAADQELQGGSGVTKWRLAKSEKGGWTLTVVTGGEERPQPVAGINENLNATFAIHQGIKNHTMKVGDKFWDTTFDLASARNVIVATRCIETPSDKNGRVWLLMNENDLTGRHEQWRLDTLARTLYEEVMPFVAKIKSGRTGPAPVKGTSSLLYESFAVPAARAAGKEERIRLLLDSTLMPDSTVTSFYTLSGNGWVLKDIPHECKAAAGQTVASRDTKFTIATSTMQSDDPMLRRCADSLVKGARSRNDSIAACYRYVYTHLEKKYTATFSNALETFRAGYGDCGEHAVLVGALLRAEHIPARVALGLVYVPGKGYLYHAWTMARCGDAWLFADAALGSYPATRDRVPLVIDDTGEGIVHIAKLIGRIKIDYVKGGK
jgi:hypothetical protein